MNNINIDKALVYSGGSITGITYIGVTKCIEEFGIRGTYNYYVGSSIGAAFAALNACRMSFKAMKTAVMDKNLVDFVTNDYGALEGLPRLLYSYGWFSNVKFAQWIETLLEQATGIKNITFEQVLDKYNNNVVITAYSCNRGTTVFYDATSAPTMPLHEAVRHSTALPFVYELVKCGNDSFSDGGLLDNLPVNYCIERNIDYTALQLVRKQMVIPTGVPANLYEMIKLVIILLREQTIRQHVDENIWKKTIRINIDGFSIIEFNLSKEQKQDLINRGYNAIKGSLNII